jgi:hypothetical protein
LIIWPIKKEDQKLNANRLNELAAVDFSFSMGEENIDADLAVA